MMDHIINLCPSHKVISTNSHHIGQIILPFIKQNRNAIALNNTPSYQVRRNTNSLLMIIALLALFNQQSNNTQLALSIPTILLNNTCLIKNLPDRGIFLKYKSSINEYFKKNQRLSFKDWINLINCYYEFQYLIICSLRQNALIYFKDNKQFYLDSAIGNEEEVLENYQIEPRNLALDIIADSINSKIIVQWNSKIHQVFGRRLNKSKMIISFVNNCKGQSYKFDFIQPMSQNKSQQNQINLALSLNKINKVKRKYNGNENSTERGQNNYEKQKKWKRKSVSKQKFNERCKICTKNYHFCQCKNMGKNVLQTYRLPDQLKSIEGENSIVALRNNKSRISKQSIVNIQSKQDQCLKAMIENIHLNLN